MSEGPVGLSGRCPKCGDPIPTMDEVIEESGKRLLSCTIRCNGCDCSLGLSALSEHVSIVYDPDDEP